MLPNRLLELLKIPLGLKIHEIIMAHGGEVRLTGGIVRDALAGRALPAYPDIDMAMTMQPDQAMALLKESGLCVIPTGIDHGTITVFEKHDNQQKIQLTTLRVDLVTDGRHADVAFTDDWHGDAERRDFTINAIYLGYDGTLFDPFHGIDDLHAGIVRFIGDADERIGEDYLRMLRFFRFYAGFSKAPPNQGIPDQQAIKAITRNAAALNKISSERITAEMDRLAQLPIHGLDAMVLTGLDRVLTREGFNVSRLKILSDTIVAPTLAACYAALVDAPYSGDFTKTLKMSNVMRESINYISTPIPDLGTWTELNWRQKAWPLIADCQKSWWNPQYLAERFALSHIVVDRNPPPFMAQITDWSYPIFPLSGQDILDAGYQAGQEIGIILNKLENHWVLHDFLPNKDDLLSMAQQLDHHHAKE